MNIEQINEGLKRLNDKNQTFGCLSSGVPTQYNGNESAPTMTVYVCSTEQAYIALRQQGARPLSTAEATHLWAGRVENNMTQFEFH